MGEEVNNQYMKGVGIDIIDIDRFISMKSDAPFIKKVFSSREIEYCFSHKDTASHLAGTLAAKEASSKALGVQKFPFISIEIRRRKDGKPEAWKGGKKISVSLSITHSRNTAAAIAIA